MPLGWFAAGGNAEMQSATLIDDVYHVLVSGKSRIGKDNAAISWLLSLAALNTPERLQIAVVDGKGGLDWQGFAGKAHTFLLAMEDQEDTAPAMEALTAERKRRGMLLKDARCSSWESYVRKGNTMPLLVVYIAELSLLESATSKNDLETWMDQELSSAGAFGMRYVIATQTATRFGTRWRGQIDLFVAGYQPAPSHNEPNTGLHAKDFGAGTPPSSLPGPPEGRGVFTCVQGEHICTVRVPYLSDDARQHWLDQLPDEDKFPSFSVVKSGDEVVKTEAENFR